MPATAPESAAHHGGAGAATMPEPAGTRSGSAAPAQPRGGGSLDPTSPSRTPRRTRYIQRTGGLPGAGGREPQRAIRLWGVDLGGAADGAAAEAARTRPALALPGPHDPPPDARRMLGICAWAAALGLIGLAIAGRAFVALALGAPPGWYEPTVVTVGVLGMALTATAYLAVQRPRLPFVLLGAATVPLGANLVATMIAL